MSAEDLLKTSYTPAPCVDGKVIPGTVNEILKKGTQNKVNMISGNVTGDTGLFGTLSIGNPFATMTTLSVADYEKGIKDTFGNFAQECLDAYPVSGDNALEQYNQINLDGLMAQQYYNAKLRSLHSNNATYIYSYNHSLPGKTNFGAYHSSDVPYWLGTLETFSADKTSYFTNADFDLSQNMTSYLINFAKDGNPNGKGLTKWKAYDGSMTNFLIGDNTFEMQKFSKEKIKFWKNYYNNLLNLKDE